MKLRRVLTLLLALALAGSPLAYATATGTPSPFAALQFADNNGAPAAGYQLFTYTAGTSSKVTTYTNVGLTSANTNPIILDSAGRCTIFLTPGTSYKYVLAPPTDTDPPIAATWTRDNISAVPPSGSASDNDVAGTAGEALSAGDAVYLSDGSGGATAGRWYRTSSTNTYSSTAAGQLGFAPVAASSAATTTVRINGRVTGLSGLTTGTLYYIAATAGTLTSTAPANARPIAFADSTTAVIVSPWVLAQASATLSGYVTAGTQTIAGDKTLTGATTLSGALTASSATPAVFGVPLTFNPGTSSTAAATVSGRITSAFADAANTNAAETDLYTGTLKLNSLSANGKVLRYTIWGRAAANANTKTIRIYLGTQTISQPASMVYNGVKWRITVEVIRVTASSERAVLITSSDGTTTTNLVQTTTGWAADLTTDLTIKATAQATTTSDIIAEGWLVEVVG